MKTEHHSYGICTLSIVPVRAAPSDKAEMTTQLLFGEALVVLELSDDKKWVRVCMAFDRYEGWIDARQFLPVPQAYYEQVIASDQPLSTDTVGYVTYRNSRFPVLAGSTLPGLQKGIMDIAGDRYTYEGSAALPSSSCSLTEVIRHYDHAPYLWGGKTPLGADCSGFVQMVYKQTGVCLPRDAWQQAAAGAEVAFADRQEGDLAFFGKPGGRITHVGIVLKDNIFVHAHIQLRYDLLDKKGIYDRERETYSHDLRVIRRIITG